MEQTAVELLIESIAYDERTKWMVNDYEWKAILKQSKLEEKDNMKEICFKTLETCNKPIEGSLNQYFEKVYNETFKNK